MDVFVKKEDNATVSTMKYIPVDGDMVNFLLNHAHFRKTDLDMKISIKPNIERYTARVEKEWLSKNKTHYLTADEIRDMLFRLADVKEEDASESVENDESESIKKEEEMYEIQDTDLSKIWLNENTCLIEKEVIVDFTNDCKEEIMCHKEEKLCESTNTDCKEKKSTNRNVRHVKCHYPDCDYTDGRSDNVKRHIANIHAETKQVRIVEHVSQETIHKLQIKYQNSISKKIINYDKVNNCSQSKFNSFIKSFDDKFVLVLLSSCTIFHSVPKPYYLKKTLYTNTNDAKHCFFSRNKFDQSTKCRVKKIINENKKKYEGND